MVLNCFFVESTPYDIRYIEEFIMDISSSRKDSKATPDEYFDIYPVEQTFGQREEFRQPSLNLIFAFSKVSYGFDFGSRSGHPFPLSLNDS